jgi:hypothetical protein
MKKTLQGAAGRCLRGLVCIIPRAQTLYHIGAIKYKWGIDPMTDDKILQS